MGNEQPTKSQIKEFWEKLEFTGKLDSIEDMGEVEGKLVYEYPPIDLNNLFEYAVPKAREKLGEPKLAQLLFRWVEKILAGEDPALALFWAIREVFKNERVKVGNKEKEVKEWK